MMGFFIALLLGVSSGISQAQLAVVRLDSLQFAALAEYRSGAIPYDTLIAREAAAGLHTVPAPDMQRLADMVSPKNTPAYVAQPEVYAVCRKVSSQLLEAEMADLNLSALLKNRSGLPFLRSNLEAYFQNQLFDFYFNNQVVGYLNNPDYVALLKPEAVYKLLKDYRTADLLHEEIRFVVNNSQYELLAH